MNPYRLLAAACLLFAPALVSAQQSLGEVLDLGGQRLAGKDLTAELVGRWIKWKSPNGVMDFSVRPDDGGQLEGSVATIRGISGPLTGKWELKDDRRFCMAAKYSAGSANGSFDRCTFWFRLGDVYWAGGSDSDRSAPVFKYSVSR